MNARRLTAATVASLCALIVASAALTATPAFAALKTTYLRQLTGVGTPQGQFSEIRGDGVAIDDFNHDTFVADSGSGLIQVFDSLGGYLDTWNGANTPAGSFGRGVAVAADNASGEVYVIDVSHNVIDVFDSSGNYLTTWDGSNTPAKSFGSLEDATVDQASGHVYVPDNRDRVIDVFDAAGDYLSQISGSETPVGSFVPDDGLAVAVDDATGEVFVAASSTGSTQPFIYVFDSTGEYLATWNGLNTPAQSFKFFLDIVVDQSNGEVLVADKNRNIVDVFDSSGDYSTPQIAGTDTPNGRFEELGGIAIDQATSDFYVSTLDRSQELLVVDVFGTATVPDVFQAAPSRLGSTAATLDGAVNPDGIELSECKFEYGTEEATYAQSAPCTPSAAQIGAGNGPVSVSAEVTGLQPDTLYHYRLVAANASGANATQDATVFTSTAPLVEAESVASVGSAGADVEAQIDAAGLPSTYRVEYGPTAAYGSSTPDVSLGNTQAVVAVRAQLSELQAGGEYHFRFVATNEFGTTFGADGTFETTGSAGASSSQLPDRRTLELVTPQRPTEDWDAYAPIECSTLLESGEFTCSARPVQASSSGNSLAYVGDPVPGGGGSSGNGYGNEFLSARNAGGGWSTSDITPPRTRVFSGVYAGFSSDLSIGVLSAFPNEPVTPDASPKCTTLYTRQAAEGRYSALFDKTMNLEETCYGAVFAGTSADGATAAFEMPTALTDDAPAEEGTNLYESTGGRLRLVNVLPDGKPVGNAKFGSAEGLLTSHVVSSDGARLFWTDLGDHDLYVREDPDTPSARTELVAEGGEYWTASTDGSLAFYTKEGDIYSFAVDGAHSTDLAPGGQVRGVIGASEDGSYVYFVGLAALNDAGGAPLKNAQGNEPVAGEDNLYVWHAGETAFVATLSHSDSADWLVESPWNGGLAESEAVSVYRTAEVAADGHGVVFTSERSLTGYDSARRGGGHCGETLAFEELIACDEVFVYSAQTGKLSCASCSPTGAPVVKKGGYLSLPTGHARLPRWINDSGTQVFFDSAEPLVAQATSGKPQVYEWEQQGSGSCRQAGGCVSLLSAGAAGHEAVFMDASADGDDVFFLTRAQLVSQDRGDDAVVYDARVDGYRPPTAPACTGSGCQGVPPGQPIFATPSSVTFNGVGNFSPAPSKSGSSAKPKAKAKQCKRGLVRKRGKCVKRKKTKKAKRSPKRSKRGSK